MALESWESDQIFAQLNSDFKWGSSIITYSFPTKSSGMIGTSAYKKGFSALNADQQAKAKLALQLWDDLIQPSFVQVAGNSDIEFSNSKKLNGYALGYYPDAGSIWFNTAESSLQKPVIGDFGFGAFIHEVGHAIGLDHMGPYDGAGDWMPSNFSDSSVFSMMSYFGPHVGIGLGDVAWADWTSADGITYSPQTPMMNDIAVIQEIYGADLTTRSGDTTYGFNATDTTITKAIYDFTINLNPILCIYDAGGIDTIDLSGWNTSCVIVLYDGTFSNANNMTKNISIASGVSIENAIGGGGNDQLIGNGLDNVLIGNAGFDMILGQDGNDTAVYAGNFADYELNMDWQSYAVMIEGGNAWIDKLFEVEYFQFDDGLFSWEDLFGDEVDTGYVSVPFASIDPGEEFVEEGTFSSSEFTFVVSLDTVWNADVTIEYAIRHKGEYTAEAYDFVGPLTGSVTIKAGENYGYFTVNIAADSDNEQTESFAVEILSATPGVIIFDDFATAYIQNDDFTPPTIIKGNKKANTLNGSDGGDDMIGLAGNDKINAKGGKDYLDGGTGNDILTGGAGEDGFRFADKKFGKDVITDFQDDLDWLSFAPIHADSFDDLTILNNGTTSVTIVMGKNTVTINGIANITLDPEDFSFA